MTLASYLSYFYLLLLLQIAAIYLYMNWLVEFNIILGILVCADESGSLVTFSDVTVV